MRCILRYVSDPDGTRERDGIRYRKVGFEEGYELLRERKPGYVRDVHVVPESDVVNHLEPPACISRLVREDERVRGIVESIEAAGVPRGDMGVTGSMLLGLNVDSSDVDFVVYGDNWFHARDAIQKAKANPESPVEEINMEMWRRIYEKRVPELSYEEFLVHEKRKGNRGMINDTYFDLLFTRAWDQINSPPERGEKRGMETVNAVVTDASLSFDSPAIYEVEHPRVDRVYSYTHTYSGQAQAGEEIEARGVLEETGDESYLVVGTTREAKGEWIRSTTLLREKGLL